ncbi:MAG: right-handed parallel beta-helix repeat-containing protein, partial [Anaerolineae bacterium]
MNQQNKINWKQNLRPFWLAVGPMTAVLLLAIVLWGISLAGVRAAPNTLYVDAGAGSNTPACGTTTTPCQTISYTVNSRAASGDVVLIAEGIYTENLAINQPYSLIGGYEAAGWTRDLNQYHTVLDGSNGGGGPAVLQFDPGSDGAEVDGFIIRNGVGGGGVNVDNTAVSIRNSAIHDNQYDQNWGGGVFVNNNGYALISNTQIISNSSGSAGGLGVMNNASAEVVNSAIDHNWSYGGDGGGIGLWWGGAVTLTNSLVRWNSAPASGGGIHVADVSETVHLTNVMLVGNEAEGGGAGLDNWGTAVLMNVTIADNFCTSQNDCTAGVGNYGPGPVLTITNSILANNDNLNLDCPDGICTITYSDVLGGWPGPGNIASPPWFADPSTAD